MPQTQRWTRRLIAAGFGVALVLTLYFGARVAIGAFYWSDPAHQDQAIEGWMPLGYVGRSWNVPRDTMIEIAGVDPSGRPRRSLEMIARDEGVPLPTLIARIESGIAQWREQPHD
ncbi:MAG: hypothetical protein KDK12_17080 [Rhodobacteraceae bacterium]|nr:hypothetical protein [Paracoccaceae bacterium]